MPLMDSDVNAARSMFDVNVFGLVAVTQAFIPLLIRSSRSGSFSPRIINMSSVVSRVPVPWQAFYNASKAAVEALGDAMRIELAPWGVTVINVMAGGAGTHFIENAQAIAPIAGVFDLPRDSIYGPARDDLVPVLRNGNPVQRALLAKCSPQRLAAAVASNALKRKPKKQLWVGEGAWMSWFASTFLWHTWSELLVPRKWRLQKIFRKLSAASRG